MTIRVSACQATPKPSQEERIERTARRSDI